MKEHNLGQLVGTVTSMAISPLGNSLAVVLKDNSSVIHLCDFSGQILHLFEGNTGQVTCVAFSSDGRFLASGSGNEMVCLWSVHSGHLLLPKQHAESITSIAFSPNSRVSCFGV
jgi:WD40 repeat protein